MCENFRLLHTAPPARRRGGDAHAEAPGAMHTTLRGNAIDLIRAHVHPERWARGRNVARRGLPAMLRAGQAVQGEVRAGPSFVARSTLTLCPPRAGKAGGAASCGVRGADRSFAACSRGWPISFWVQRLPRSSPHQNMYCLIDDVPVMASPSKACGASVVSTAVRMNKQLHGHSALIGAPVVADLDAKVVVAKASGSPYHLT